MIGTVVWGARTLAGPDSDYKYVPVKRLVLFLEQSIAEGTQWAVFEPNAEPLWAEIRLSVGAFLQQMFQTGAFAGNTPTQAYYVKCDATTTTQADINSGVLNIVVGCAPVRPSEFVVFRIQQLCGMVA